MIYNKVFHTPMYTEAPGEPPADKPRELADSDNAFKELLEQKIREEGQVFFSKYAIECVVEWGVDISSEKAERLNEGIRIVRGKGLKGLLILLGFTAFVINMKNNKVVTVVSEDSLRGMVFASIDRTAIIQPVLLEAIPTPNDGRVRRLEKEN